MVAEEKGEIRYINVHGKTIHYMSARLIKAYKDDDPYSFEKDKHQYIKVNPYWYAFIGHINRSEFADIAGLKVFDMAVPQDWFDAHFAEIKKRGGVLWSYDGKCKTFGCPIFWDQVYHEAIKTLKKYAPVKPHIIGRR
jgi:hypothetical protein